MELGVIFPQTDIGADVGGVRAYLEAVRDMGFRHVAAFDHVLGADRAAHAGFSGPYDTESLFHEPLALFAYMAGVAPELAPITDVIILPQRQAAMVAKQAAEVDVLTGGKLILGVGIGWNAVEYEALGMRFENRARRFEEQIDLMRRLWSEPVVSFEGRYHKVTAAGLNPLPVQRPIPIWIGGSAEPALERAAKVADGFLPLGRREGNWAAILEKMRGWRESVGKSWDGFGIGAGVSVATTPPEQWRAQAEEWRRVGATHLHLNPMGAGWKGPDGHIARLREAKEELG